MLEEKRRNIYRFAKENSKFVKPISRKKTNFQKTVQLILKNLKEF